MTTTRLPKRPTKKRRRKALTRKTPTRNPAADPLAYAGELVKDREWRRLKSRELRQAARDVAPTKPTIKFKKARSLLLRKARTGVELSPGAQRVVQTYRKELKRKRTVTRVTKYAALLVAQERAARNEAIAPLVDRVNQVRREEAAASTPDGEPRKWQPLKPEHVTNHGEPFSIAVSKRARKLAKSKQHFQTWCWQTTRKAERRKRTVRDG